MRTLVSFMARTVVRVSAQGAIDGISFDGQKQPLQKTQNALSLAPDWESREWSGDAIPSELFVEERSARIAHYIEHLLLGLETELQVRVLSRMEALFQEGAAADAVLRRVLIAPLRAPDRLDSSIELALSHGLAAVSDLLHSVRDLQPLLRRLAAAWLDVPEEMFGSLGRSRQAVWRELTDRGTALKLLWAQTGTEFLRTWGPFTLAAGIGAPVLHAIGKSLAHTLMPDSRPFEEMDELASEVSGDIDRRRMARRPSEPGGLKKERAEKQIEAILQAVAAGRDQHAAAFLEQLIESQSDEDSKYAVMSLCNIAQRCADMYRADFERKCLEKARQLAPWDSWLLVQLGDHLKRMGQYDDALALLAAEKDMGNRVAVSLCADIWAERGDFSRALAEYQLIPGADVDPIISMARADIYRQQGRTDEAAALYSSMLAEGRSGTRHRALAGMAMIDIRQRKYKEAIISLEEAIADPGNDSKSSLVYRSSLCRALKLEGSVERALQIADDLVRESPFFMTARLQRAALNTLLGRGWMALGDLPDRRGGVAFAEWRQSYIRGLILLRLKRYDQARDILTTNFALNEPGDSRNLQRLAAAVAYLHGQSRRDLNSVRPLIASQAADDPFAEHIRIILNLHLAMLQHDVERAAKLEDQLNPWMNDGRVVSIVRALRTGRFEPAVHFEVEQLLRAA